MLRIGPNHYELVRAHSGFSVTIQPRTDDVLQRDQVWNLEAHFVPAETRYTLRPDGNLEYLNFRLRSEEYAVKDWHRLSGLGLDTAASTWFGQAWIENLLMGKYGEETWRIAPGWLEVERAGDFLFHCKFNGLVEEEDLQEEIEFEDDIPFCELTAYVPINAADPVATARAMASQAVGLTEFGDNRVQRYDPNQRSFSNININTHHVVTLQTPWRHQTA